MLIFSCFSFNYSLIFSKFWVLSCFSFTSSLNCSFFMLKNVYCLAFLFEVLCIILSFCLNTMSSLDFLFKTLRSNCSLLLKSDFSLFNVACISSNTAVCLIFYCSDSLILSKLLRLLNSADLDFCCSLFNSVLCFDPGNTYLTRNYVR